MATICARHHIVGTQNVANPCRDGLLTDLVTDAVLKSARTRQWEKVPTAQVKVA